MGRKDLAHIPDDIKAAAFDALVCMMQGNGELVGQKSFTEDIRRTSQNHAECGIIYVNEWVYRFGVTSNDDDFCSALIKTAEEFTKQER